MINANELRFGNWVQTGGIQSVIDELGDTLCHLEGNMIPNRYDQIEPIPLSPEILSKCGFEVYRNDHQYTFYGNHGDDSDFFLEFNWMRRDEGYIPMIKSVEFEVIGSSIQYLHQLQNLYFALTGNELEIKL
jgi:hypothetical protein